MNGIDPWAFMQDLAGRIDGLTERAEIEETLDRMEYLLEVLDPELQEPAYTLVDKLRDKLAQAPQ
jgi:hypothetical protein